MKTLRAALLAGLPIIMTTAALAQSSPGFYTGQVPTAAQWNSAFASKQDYSAALTAIANGSTPVTIFSSTVSGTVPASGGGTTYFLRADGAWASPGGGVTTVFGRSGAVVAVSGDYGVAQVTGAAPLASPTFTGTVTVPNGAALGTPASLTLTSATGLPISTGVSGLGTGVATFLATPSSANLAAALTDETGTGANVFANGPTLINPALGTIASGVGTALTALNASNITSGTIPSAQLPLASTSVFGAMKCDGTTTTCASGVVSATGTGNAVLSPTTGNVSGNLVTMSNTTTGVTDSGVAVSNVATLAGAQTLTNKTMSGANNTFSAIPSSGLVTSFNSQTGTTYTVLAGDGGKIVSFANAGAIANSLFSGSTAGSGWGSDFYNGGAGLLTTTLLAGNFDNGQTSIAVVKGQELFPWSDGTTMHAWVSLPPISTGTLLCNTSGHTEYPGGCTSTNITNLLSANPLAVTNTTQNWTGMQSNGVTTLTIATATFTPDGTNNNYKITLSSACPCTIANPSGGFAAGSAGTLEVIQDGTGGRTIGTWGSSYLAAGGVSTLAPLSTGANAIDTFSFFAFDSTHILLAPGALNASH